MSIENSKIGHYRWRVIALLFFATTINYIDRQVLGMLKPVITDDIHISEADYGYIVSAFQAAYALGLLFIGRIIDKFGTRISYAVAIVVWSLAGCFHAAARGALSVRRASPERGWEKVVAASRAMAASGQGDAPSCRHTGRAIAEWPHPLRRG